MNIIKEFFVTEIRSCLANDIKIQTIYQSFSTHMIRSENKRHVAGQERGVN